MGAMRHPGLPAGTHVKLVAAIDHQQRRAGLRSSVTLTRHGDEVRFAWTDADRLPHWRVTGSLDLEPGGVTIRALGLEPIGEAPRGGITADDLRKVAVGEIAKYAMAELRYAALEDDLRMAFSVKRPAAEVRPSIDKAITEPVVQRGGGRPRTSDAELRMVAECAIEAGGSHSLGAQLLGAKLGRVVPEQTMKDKMQRARDAGWLAPATKQGRRGAEPGPRLIHEANQ